MSYSQEFYLAKGEILKRHDPNIKDGLVHGIIVLSTNKTTAFLSDGGQVPIRFKTSVKDKRSRFYYTNNKIPYGWYHR